MPPDQAAVAVAIVAGNQSKISKPLINAYRDSGLAHFLSISGLHMSMLAGLMFFLVRFVMALVPALSLRYNSKKRRRFWQFLSARFIWSFPVPPFRRSGLL